MARDRAAGRIGKVAAGKGKVRRRGAGAAASAMGVRAKFWLTFGQRTLFGDGKAELLERIDRSGSLHAAAEQMGMSYRHAWGLLRELEREAGFALLEHHGSGPRAPLALSAEARDFLRAWHAFRDPLDALVARRFRRAFSG